MVYRARPGKGDTWRHRRRVNSIYQNQAEQAQFQTLKGARRKFGVFRCQECKQRFWSKRPIKIWCEKNNKKHRCGVCRAKDEGKEWKKEMGSARLTPEQNALVEKEYEMNGVKIISQKEDG